MGINQFLVIIEKATENYSAYAPSLPGCVATGKTLKETEKNMVEAIQLHIEGMREDHLSFPIK
jgi:predicted RNase H-like HicB family nuclease